MPKVIIISSEHVRQSLEFPTAITAHAYAIVCFDHNKVAAGPHTVGRHKLTTLYMQLISADTHSGVMTPQARQVCQDL